MGLIALLRAAAGRMTDRVVANTGCLVYTTQVAYARSTAQPSRPTARVRLYARVSSKDQEKEGFSIPAQLKLLREYAATQGLTVAEEYVDVETAKRTGRVSFGKMVDDLRTSPGTRIVLVEKTDRLYRNLKDWVTLDGLDVEVHLVKEGVVLSRESRSSEKFMHGIKVLMAKNYIDNLSEETRKGMTEKAQQGLWPSFAPIGYRNVMGANGRRMIAPDPHTAPIIVRLFEWYATGTMSLKELTRKAREEGLSFRKSGDPVPRSTIHTILRKRLYMGEVDWDGHIYPGAHEPLVSRDLWEQVQAVLEGRHATRHRRAKRNFAFSRLITCGHCGCAVVGEIKKRRYVYYHCTGYKGKCPEPYVREEVLEQQFSKLLGRLTFDAEVLDWVREALVRSHEDEQRAHHDAIERLQAEYVRLQHRLDAMYVDKLDGRIDATTFDRMAATWRSEQANCRRLIEQHEAANQSYMAEGVRLLELARRARRLFEKQEAREKRRLLDFLVSNCSWQDGDLTAEFRQPFDSLADTAMAAATATAEGRSESAKSEIWLLGLDSNQQPSG